MLCQIKIKWPVALAKRMQGQLAAEHLIRLEVHELAHSSVIERAMRSTYPRIRKYLSQNRTLVG